MKRTFALLMVVCIAQLLAGRIQAQERLRLATTTSVQDSGLMPYLLAHFEKKCGCKVDVIAVGSGQALKLAANGDVDMVLVHDPSSEEKFVADGYGVNRRTFMVNDFVLLGPPSDPARIKGMNDAARAFSSIQKAGAPFISRGDASGTHQKEKYQIGNSAKLMIQKNEAIAESLYKMDPKKLGIPYMVVLAQGLNFDCPSTKRRYLNKEIHMLDQYGYRVETIKGEHLILFYHVHEY